MAEMMGVGALAGHLLTSTVVSGMVGITSEATVERVQADARRMAKQISKQLEQFFSSQGWLGVAKRS